MKINKIFLSLILVGILTASSAGSVLGYGVADQIIVGSNTGTSVESSAEGSEAADAVSGEAAASTEGSEAVDAGSGETAASTESSEAVGAASGETAANAADLAGDVAGNSLIGETAVGGSAGDGADAAAGDNADTAGAAAGAEIIEDAAAPAEETVGVKIRRDIEDGLYILVPRLASNRCMGVAGNSRVDGANIELVNKNGGFGQAFYVRRVPNTSRYTFVNYHTGKAVEWDKPTADAGGAKYVFVTQNAYTRKMNQQWVLEEVADGYLQIRACGKALVLDLANAQTDAGTDLRLCSTNHSDAQMWTLVKASGKVAAEARLVDAGLTRGYYRIAPAGNTALAVDITSNSKKDNANIRVYKRVNSGAQFFRVVPIGDGTYTINGYNSGKYFDCVNAKSGSNIYQAASRKSGYQRWYILKDPETGAFVIRNKVGSHVVMTADSLAEKANVGHRSFAGSTEQYWNLTKIHSSKIHVEPKDGIYEFRSGLDGNMCLDVANGSSLNNGNIQLYTVNGTDAQRFAIVGSGYGYFKVLSVNSMRAMHLKGNNAASGTNVVQYKAINSTAQKWRITWNDKTGGYQVQPSGKSTRLAVAGGKAVNGANVQADTADNSAGQMWVLKRISSYDSTYHMKVMCSGTNCIFKVYRIENGVFKTKLSTSGFIGRNGSGKTREGDGKTPIGTFTVGKAYGIADDPGSVIPYTKVTDDMYWCGRSESPYYNTLIDSSKAGAGDEHLIEYTEAYKYLLDIGYNTECKPGRGSAIFLHCSRNQPTAGCVSIPTEDMVKTLRMIGVGTKISIE